MTITLTGKNQITIPGKFVKHLGLSRGSLFDIRLNGNRLELVPMETIEKTFTDEEYLKLENIFQKEKNTAKKITCENIERL